jgi:hypothetical protein
MHPAVLGHLSEDLVDGTLAVDRTTVTIRHRGYRRLHRTCGTPPVTLGDGDQRAAGSWSAVTTTAGLKSDALAAVALD